MKAGHFQEARQALLLWYAENKRDLPWRQNRDPYAILVSELMLQQTRVDTVIPYFNRFMKLFPSFLALANASESDVLKAWEGLGYYRRARHLQESARQIVATYRGVFPDEKEQIDALKGIGPYTSAAIASIAFELPHACLDGNVMRVLARLFASYQDISSHSGKKHFQRLADSFLDKSQPGAFNQALMELGATVCTPRQPTCMACPLFGLCNTRVQGDDPHLLPVKEKRVIPSHLEMESLFLCSGSHFLMGKRLEKGLMADMWELPAKPVDEAPRWDQLFSQQIQGFPIQSKAILHKFTHLHVTYHLRGFSAPEPLEWIQRPNGYQEFAWMNAERIACIPTTKVFRKQWINIEKMMLEELV